MFNQKKINKFLRDNFPPYCKSEIINETNDEIIILLNYGYNEDQIEITIGKTPGNEGLYRLESTNFKK